jgi:hypothetical protein
MRQVARGNSESDRRIDGGEGAACGAQGAAVVEALGGVKSGRCGTTLFGSAAFGSWPSFLRGLSATGAATTLRPGLSRSARFASASSLVPRTQRRQDSTCHSYRAIIIGISCTTPTPRPSGHGGSGSRAERGRSENVDRCMRHVRRAICPKAERCPGLLGYLQANSLSPAAARGE